MEKYTPTYWNKKGKYQKAYDKMYRELVPLEGKAETKAGEVLRWVSRVYYDHFNNGGWNIGGTEKTALVKLCPPEIVEHVIMFCKPFDPVKDYVRMEHCDKFVDWAINYAATLVAMEKI